MFPCVLTVQFKQFRVLLLSKILTVVWNLWLITRSTSKESILFLTFSRLNYNWFNLDDVLLVRFSSKLDFAFNVPSMNIHWQFLKTLLKKHSANLVITKRLIAMAEMMLDQRQTSLFLTLVLMKSLSAILMGFVWMAVGVQNSTEDSCVKLVKRGTWWKIKNYVWNVQCFGGILAGSF